jgi:hypothetical protein
MADEPANFLPQYLRGIDSKLDSLAEKVFQLGQRLGSLESQVRALVAIFPSSGKTSSG